MNLFGFIWMCTLLMLIAIVGFVYFTIQDRKEAKRNAQQH